MTETGVINKTALVFGQMDEPPGTRLRVALSALTMAEYFRDVQKQDVLCLSITFSALRKLALKYQLFLDVCHLPWVTSLRWPMRWVSCKNVLPTRGHQLHLCRRFMFLPMTLRPCSTHNICALRCNNCFVPSNFRAWYLSSRGST